MDYFPNHSHAGLYLFRILHSTQDTLHEQQACHMVVLFASAQGLANMYTILAVFTNPQEWCRILYSHQC